MVSPTKVNFAGIFEQGIYIEALNMSRSFVTYESNVLFALRFMIDHEVVGGNWIEFPPASYTFQGPGHSHKLSHCQLEAHIHCNKLISHKPEGTYCLYLHQIMLQTLLNCVHATLHALPFVEHGDPVSSCGVEQR